MRPHMPSLAIGLVACAVVLVTMSQALPGSNSPRIEYGPHPRDMIQIKEGTPYMVPANHIFVLTGLGTAGNAGVDVRTLLKVNGQLEASSKAETANAAPSILVMPTGFTVAAGSTIEVDDQLSGTAYQTGRAWGYLAK